MKKLFLMPPGTVALDDLADLDKRGWAVYEDSWGDKVHHLAYGMTEEDAKLFIAAKEAQA